jgi:hypothetical protein
MRRRTRHFLVYASILALAFLELSSPQQVEVLRNPAGEMSAAVDVGVGPLLFCPRVVPPTDAGISVPVVTLPDVVTISHAGHLPLALGDVGSLQ